MANHHTYTITGAADIELGTPRSRPMTYTVTLPDGQAPGETLPGLVFFIPGFGEDNDAGYIKSFADWVADTFGFGCVGVQYHAIGCRVSSGAKRSFTQPDADRLVRACVTYGAAVKDGDPPGVLLEEVHKAYRSAVASGRAKGVLSLTCGLMPVGGEKQNFGLMQALDHLHVLADLKHKLSYDTRNVIAIGSSHGGYLAQLIAKLAPNTLRAVFDNSGYAAPPDRYINGRETNLPNFSEHYSPDMVMHFYVASMWSLDPKAPNFFNSDARAVRSLNEPRHLSAMAEAGSTRTRYRCVHGPADPIAPPDEKAAYCAMLSDAGFDVGYQCMGPTDVDGRYVKTLDHGLGLSLRGFFERSYATLPEQDLAGAEGNFVGDDFTRATSLTYAGPQRAYQFQYGSNGIEAAIS